MHGKKQFPTAKLQTLKCQKKMGKESNNNKSESLMRVGDKMAETISVSHSFTLRYDELSFFLSFFLSIYLSIYLFFLFFFLSIFSFFFLSFFSTNEEVYGLEIRVVKNSFKTKQASNSILIVELLLKYFKIDRLFVFFKFLKLKYAPLICLLLIWLNYNLTWIFYSKFITHLNHFFQRTKSRSSQ